MSNRPWRYPPLDEWVMKMKGRVKRRAKRGPVGAAKRGRFLPQGRHSPGRGRRQEKKSAARRRAAKNYWVWNRRNGLLKPPRDDHGPWRPTNGSHNRAADV
jgi:hypothetical protein